jgi:acetyl-CoA synthetase (ADP-forming)
MTSPPEILPPIHPAPQRPTRSLSEAASKSLLAAFGLPFLDEELVNSGAAAVNAAERFGYPVVAKLCGDAIAHKTERGLVRLNLNDAESLAAAVEELLAAARPTDGALGVLVAPMVRGARELIAGLVDDPQFGMTIMVGIGGIAAEALGDVAIRLAPITELDAQEMLDDLSTQALLGPFRGEPAVDRAEVQRVLMALSTVAAAHPEVVSVDLNPLIIVDGKPVAVDALVEVQS